MKPLDYPTPDRPHRVYFALTNHCNRACPWCSTCSSPQGTTWMTAANYVARFPAHGRFEVQLEGGEPTLHPEFFEFVGLARDNPRCTHVVLCTNGAVLPRNASRLRPWLQRLGAPLTIKLSVNHYLLDRDSGLVELCALVRDVLRELGGDRQFVINVRLRRGIDNDDAWVRAAIERAGLLPYANVFFLQRYGFASTETAWEPPVVVSTHFTLVNPDGRHYGPDLVARSEAMRVLP